MNNLEETSIHAAVRSGNIQTVREILQSDPYCVNNIDKIFGSPLHVIYHHVDLDGGYQADDRLQIMQLLIDYGADVNIRSQDDFTTLSQTIVLHQINGVKMLLKNKADPNTREIHNVTALMTAVSDGCEKNYDDQIIEMLLDHGADPNLADVNGDTALDIAVRGCKFDFVQILLHSGARVKNVYLSLMKIFSYGNISEPPNKDSLRLKNFLWSYMETVEDQTVECSQFFISKLRYCFIVLRQNKDKRIIPFLESLKRPGIDINYSFSCDSDLHAAVRDGNLILVIALLKKEETNVNATNFYHENSLHLIFNGEDSILFEIIGCLLINAGADWRATNLIDETPFYLAVNQKKVILVHSIFYKIARVDSTTLQCDLANLPTLTNCYTENDAALHELLVAIRVGCEPVIDRLLDDEYNIDEVSKLRRQDITIALAEAVKLKKYEIVKKFLEAGFRSDGRFTGDLFDLRFIERDKIGLSCLLWEFKDRKTLEKLNCLTVNNYSANSESNDLICCLLFYHVIDEYVKGSILDSTILRRFSKRQNIPIAKLSECKNVLFQMKDIELSNISIFDIMTIELNSFVKFLNNEELHSVCTKVAWNIQNHNERKYYEVALQHRLDLALEKNIAMNNALHCFNDISRNYLVRTNLSSLPYKVGWEILSNLNMRDLKQLACSNV